MMFRMNNVIYLCQARKEKPPEAAPVDLLDLDDAAPAAPAASAPSAAPAAAPQSQEDGLLLLDMEDAVLSQPVPCSEYRIVWNIDIDTYRIKKSCIFILHHYMTSIASRPEGACCATCASAGPAARSTPGALRKPL